MRTTNGLYPYYKWKTFSYIGNSFEEIERAYNSIRPISGKRRASDIRPIGDRRRWWERIVKVSSNEYTVTDRYQWAAISSLTQRREQRLVSFFKNGEVAIYGTNWRCANTSSIPWWSCISTPQFVAQVLPDGIDLHKYDTKMYVSIQEGDTRNYYLVSGTKGGLRLKKVDGSWKVLNPTQEHTYRVSKQVKDRVAGQKIKEFKKYATSMWGLIDEEIWTNQGTPHLSEWTLAHNRRVKEMLRSKSNWFEIACGIWHASRRYTYTTYGGNALIGRYEPGNVSDFPWNKLMKAACRHNKTKFTKQEVPIGEPCRRHWLEK